MPVGVHRNVRDRQLAITGISPVKQNELKRYGSAVQCILFDGLILDNAHQLLWLSPWWSGVLFGGS